MIILITMLIYIAAVMIAVLCSGSTGIPYTYHTNHSKYLVWDLSTQNKSQLQQSTLPNYDYLKIHYDCSSSMDALQFYTEIWSNVSTQYDFRANYSHIIIYASGNTSWLALKLIHSNALRNAINGIVLLSPDVLRSFQRIFTNYYSNFIGITSEQKSSQHYFLLSALSNVLLMHKLSIPSQQIYSYAYQQLMSNITYLNNYTDKENTTPKQELGYSTYENDTDLIEAMQMLNNTMRSYPMLIISESGNYVNTPLGIEMSLQLLGFQQPLISAEIIRNNYIGEMQHEQNITYLKLRNEGQLPYLSEIIERWIIDYC